MKTSRNLLFAALVVLSCLFAVQPAGASALATTQECDDIGPLPFRLSTLGFGVADPKAVLESALMAVPACLIVDEPADDTASDDASTCKVIGPTASASGSVSPFVSACLVSPNLLDVPATKDDRVCDTAGVMMKQAHACISPD